MGGILATLGAAAENQPGYRLIIDLEQQTVTTPEGEVHAFAVDEFRRHCLLNGFDDIELTLQHSDDIRQYEEKRRQEAPWLFAGA